MSEIDALEKLRSKIENAYFTRLTQGEKDYPPFKLLGFEDRPVYHHFIIKLIDEEINSYKGIKK